MREVYIKISGNVQGVFFRASTKRYADDNNVNGWVRNCTDGSVEAVLQGQSENITKVIEWCKIGPEQATVDAVKVSEQPLTAPYTDFRIMS